MKCCLIASIHKKKTLQTFVIWRWKFPLRWKLQTIFSPVAQVSYGLGKRVQKKSKWAKNDYNNLSWIRVKFFTWWMMMMKLLVFVKFAMCMRCDFIVYRHSTMDDILASKTIFRTRRGKSFVKYNEKLTKNCLIYPKVNMQPQITSMPMKWGFLSMVKVYVG